MRRHALMPVFLALAVCAAGWARSETKDSDPKAVEIADQVIGALGGKEKWNAMPCLGWTFEAAVKDTMRPGGRHHVWQKSTGWHRVEGKNRQGQPFVIIQRLGTPEGKAWVNGVAIEGDSLQKLLKRAQSMWTNDTYWMLMPYKLRDPGVRLHYEAEVKDDGITYDKISLSFENVGETPGDHYWIYVDRANHRVERKATKRRTACGFRPPTARAT
ncbi:MAG: hypothetical protein E6K80_13850 [Candidatus Eisenbacteria bacterium]|uniref:Outer membrane lipoprotein-sorting protein n=1 Tax=Eiseniibacteriota bacterium TaxID=2212470 RepID=A0A538TYX8_UNCEI|nr:MAG: hypothetical protein E6K80_13850 [Candidatus Eisenbacteria bacterium]